MALLAGLPELENEQKTATNIETITELFVDDARKRWLGPFEAIKRERLLISASSTEKSAKNIRGFLGLFPSYGLVLERQFSVDRVLSDLGQRSGYIANALARRMLPEDWRKAGEIVQLFGPHCQKAQEIAIEVLEQNNLPVLEQGPRRREFEAMATLVRNTDYSSLVETMKDGEGALLSLTHGNVPRGTEILRRWKDVVLTYLQAEYGSANNDRFAEHFYRVRNLPVGALYAYIKVLSMAGKAPKSKIIGEDIPEQHAPNPLIWIEEREKEFRDDLRKARLRKALL